MSSRGIPEHVAERNEAFDFEKVDAAVQNRAWLRVSPPPQSDLHHMASTSVLRRHCRGCYTQPKHEEHVRDCHLSTRHSQHDGVIIAANDDTCSGALEMRRRTVLPQFQNPLPSSVVEIRRHWEANEWGRLLQLL